MMLYYIPLESYRERYSAQWAAPKTGWLERNWIKHQIPYVRIDSPHGAQTEDGIKTGIVLDAGRRTAHCFSQVEQILDLAIQGKITNNDVIYFDDFWHLGIEALSYTFHILNIKPKMFAFCHAQSVDVYDFTYPMRSWMRHFEKGIGEILSGIFVNCDILKNLLIDGGIGNRGKIHVIGHIFSSEEVEERMSKTRPKKENHIIFSSRWDDEKNPMFFLTVADNILQKRKDIKFIICTSQRDLRSNNPQNLRKLKEAMEKYPENIILKENLTKEEYYFELCKAKIQMNTAYQDFTSIALLEASVAGCFPVYPYFRSFPQAFRHTMDYMYWHLNSSDASSKLIYILNSNRLWSKKEIQERAWIHERHNTSWARMINIMMEEQLIELGGSEATYE